MTSPIIILCITTLTFTAIACHNKDMLQLYQGVLQGAQLELDITLIDSCISDKDISYELLNQINNSTPTPTETMQSIAQVLTQIPSAMTKCLKADEIADEFNEVIKLISHPNILTNGYIMDGINIKSEIDTAMQFWKEQNYYGYGQQIGSIIYKIQVIRYTNIDTLAQSKEVLIQIYSGFVRGFYEEGGVKIEDIQECFSGATGAINDFIGGVQLIASMEPKHVKEGLRLLGMGLEILPGAIRTCQQASQEMQDFSTALEDALALMISPRTFAFEIGKHLIVNGRDILTETITAVNDWNEPNYSDFGYQLGRIVYQLVVGEVLYK